MTTKINRVHALVIVNMYAKFDEYGHSDLVSFMFTMSKRDGKTDTRTHSHTDGTTAALQHSLRNALRGDDNPPYRDRGPTTDRGHKNTT